MKKLWIVLGVVLVSGSLTISQVRGDDPATQPTTQPASTQPTQYDPCAEAMALLRDHRYAEAHEAFLAVKKVKPNSADVFLGLGTTLLYLGKDQDAAHSLERANMLRPGDRLTMLNLAVARIRINDFDRAMNTMTALSASRELTELEVDLWITSAVGMNKGSNRFYDALGKLESTRPGFKKWGISWVSEKEFKTLQSQYQEALKRLQSLKDRVDDQRLEVKKWQGRVEKARREAAIGGGNDDYSPEYRKQRLRSMEESLAIAKKSYDSALKALDDFKSTMARPPVMHSPDPVPIN